MHTAVGDPVDSMTVEEMRAVVRTALEDRHRSNTRKPLTDLTAQIIAAARVLAHPRCPADVMTLVVTHPTGDRRIPGRPLATTVLSRPDCPDEVKVAWALSAVRGKRD